MNQGLLWYDGDAKRGLEEKIGRAAQRYREKYGRPPDTCYVNPSQVAGSGGAEADVVCQVQSTEGSIRVVTAVNVLPHHFWLGEAGRTPQGRTRAAH